MKKNLSEKQIKQYQKILLATQSKILKDIDHLESHTLGSHRENSGDLSGYSLHMADVGTDNYERELALDVVGNEQDILYQIESALKRIENGSYGICEMMNVPIQKKRLDAIPWTPFCIEAAEKVEQQNKK